MREAPRKRSHPLRRLMLAQNVVTLLAAGGLVVSVGAFATVIGIGEAQIASAHGYSGDCWHNTWFCVGLPVGLLGLLCLVFALSTNWSQVRALHRFPDLSIAMMPPGSGGSDGHTTRLHVSMRITNRETQRNANLEAILYWQLDPRVFRDPVEWLFPPVQDESLTIAPGTTRRMKLDFGLDRQVDESEGPRLEIVDHLSGRRITFPAIDGLYDLTTWRSL